MSELIMDKFIHSFITWIYIAPLQGYYSEALPTLGWLKRAVLRLEQNASLFLSLAVVTDSTVPGSEFVVVVIDFAMVEFLSSLFEEFVDLLGGKGRQGKPAAHLRHLVPRFEAAQGVAEDPGGGGEARPSQTGTRKCRQGKCSNRWLFWDACTKCVTVFVF